MDLSIIIVNWNARDLLDNCLKSIEDNRGDLNLEVWVVDNASHDGSGQMVEELHPEAKLIHSGGNIGFARANNLARSCVTAPVVLFLNPDTLVGNGALQAMIHTLKADSAVAGVSCKIRDESGVVQELPSQWWMSPTTKGVELFLLSEQTRERMQNIIPYHDPEASGYVSYLYGSCLMMEKRVLDDVGWFDERFFMYCEDVDLCHRVLSRGRKLFYLADVEIVHRIGGATKKAPGHFAGIMMLESIKKLMGKYYGTRGTVSFTSMVFINAQIRLILLMLIRMYEKINKLDRQVNYEFSCSKYINAIKWCMNVHPGTRP